MCARSLMCPGHPPDHPTDDVNHGSEAFDDFAKTIVNPGLAYVNAGGAGSAMAGSAAASSALAGSATASSAMALYGRAVQAIMDTREIANVAVSHGPRVP